MSVAVWMEARCENVNGPEDCWEGDEGCFSSNVREYLSELKKSGWKVTKTETFCPHCAEQH